LPSLSADEQEAVEQFAEKIGAGLEGATTAEQHRIYELLQLRGTVRLDPEHGIKLGRRRFSIDWQAVLDLRHETTRLTSRPGT
jgi:hypothetical protein